VAELSLENLAVIERVRLPLGPGFVVFTGETGVGKSIVVDALRLLAGGRARADLIRAGAPQAVVEGVFRDVPPTVWPLLAEAGVAVSDDPDSGAELVVRRVIARDGPSAAYVNDRRVGLALLARVGDLLVDVQGQHAQRSLLSEAAHGALLDAVAGLGDAVADYRSRYEALGALDRELAAADSGRREAEARQAFLNFALEEIDGAALEADEEDRLTVELARLGHAEHLQSEAGAAHAALYTADGAVLDRLARAQGHIDAVTRVLPDQAEVGELADQARLLLEEAVERLRTLKDAIRPDPSRQALVTERLGRIEDLKRKYGRTVADILQAAETFRAERDRDGDVAGRTARLRTEREALLVDLGRRAEGLETARQQAGEKLVREVAGCLKDLAMPHARLAVEALRCREGIPHGDHVLGPTGRSRFRFLLAANPGEPPQPLARVASGGELSRIMLALRLALIDVDPVPCLAFDEVDAGLGGGVAARMGRMLRDLARCHQVFCVTHLPQVASLADTHVRVTKSTRDGRTHTHAAPLDAPARVAEIARMLGGVTVTEATREHAREMLAATGGTIKSK